jgi:hypothetical protein
MNEKERQETIEFLKKRLERKFVELEEPMKQIEFTRENYNSLFPNNYVSTPIGRIKIGEHQYEKLEKEKRHKYLGAMFQTLTDPIAIINQEDNRGNVKLFSKSFEHKPKKKDGVISVVADINGENISISTHPKHLKKVIDGIKNAADLVYEKPNSGLTAGNDSKNLAISDDTQLTNNISQAILNVKGDKNKFIN